MMVTPRIIINEEEEQRAPFDSNHFSDILLSPRASVPPGYFAGSGKALLEPSERCAMKSVSYAQECTLL